mmetsp:Transcript_5003/g.7421  ORF Transcript_5003/g.7421 Transcript_5003/m.7421 type:complete len:617 (+) Transcript_5003:219-2069(+)
MSGLSNSTPENSTEGIGESVNHDNKVTFYKDLCVKQKAALTKLISMHNQTKTKLNTSRILYKTQIKTLKEKLQQVIDETKSQLSQQQDEFTFWKKQRLQEVLIEKQKELELKYKQKIDAIQDRLDEREKSIESRASELEQEYAQEFEIQQKTMIKEYQDKLTSRLTEIEEEYSKNKNKDRVLNKFKDSGRAVIIENKKKRMETREDELDRRQEELEDQSETLHQKINHFKAHRRQVEQDITMFLEEHEDLTNELEENTKLMENVIENQEENEVLFESTLAEKANEIAQLKETLKAYQQKYQDSMSLPPRTPEKEEKVTLEEDTALISNLRKEISTLKLQIVRMTTKMNEDDHTLQQAEQHVQQCQEKIQHYHESDVKQRKTIEALQKQVDHLIELSNTPDTNDGDIEDDDDIISIFHEDMSIDECKRIIYKQREHINYLLSVADEVEERDEEDALSRDELVSKLRQDLALLKQSKEEDAVVHKTLLRTNQKELDRLQQRYQVLYKEYHQVFMMVESTKHENDMLSQKLQTLSISSQKKKQSAASPHRPSSYQSRRTPTPSKNKRRHIEQRRRHLQEDQAKYVHTVNEINSSSFARSPTTTPYSRSKKPPSYSSTDL